MESADVELLPRIISGFNKLLNLPPMIEGQLCEVSNKYQGLLGPASKSVERLIMKRHPASLKPDSLNVLDKLMMAHGYLKYGLGNTLSEFSKLVPAWPELNRALFWFKVGRVRKAISKKDNDRLTNYRQVPVLHSFWQFEVSDFEYVVDEISGREFIDDKLVALSLAFNLYVKEGRPRTWREKLTKLVREIDNAELSHRLKTCLKPPPQSEETRRWKRQDAKWKRQDEARRRQEEKILADKKKWLTDNLEDFRMELREPPGIMTNPMYYLYEQTLEIESSSDNETETGWKALIPEFGEKIARFYRDGTVDFWRHYKPKTQSEGAPSNHIHYDVSIGLTGLEIEAREDVNWTEHLSPAEVETACRYATYELNGFPSWFPDLFNAHPERVCEFLMQEIRYELSIENPETNTHYVISDVCWTTGPEAWDILAPGIYEQLEEEPQNLSNLDMLLTIVQRSSLPDEQVEKLASRKCRIQTELRHQARWFAVWAGVSPEAAIASLNQRLSEISNPQEQTLFAMIFVTQLIGDRRGEGARKVFQTPDNLKSLYLLMNEHIRPDEDIDRPSGVAYTPELRDEAQKARDSLFNLLNQIPGKEAFLALNELARVHLKEKTRKWIGSQAKKRAEQDSDRNPWSPEQVREFNEDFERTPGSHRELAELAELRLLDLKYDLEQGDDSIAATLQKEDIGETEIRTLIGWQLREKANGRYSISQEEELADGKQPDLRFHRNEIDGPVPVELKLADNWTGPELFERMENQLRKGYLRDERSNRGIYLLMRRGYKKRWKLPNGKYAVFSDLINTLQGHWHKISPHFPGVEYIKVIGIELTQRRQS